MRGSVIKRGNTYMAYYYTGEKINGDYVRKTKSGFKTKKEAQKFLRLVIDDIESGINIQGADVLLKRFLTDWLDEYSKIACLAENTYRGYHTNIVNHVIPVIGDIKLNSLKPEHIDKLLLILTYKGLSATTQRYVIAVLKKALNWAVKRRIISYNVIDYVDIPKSEKYIPTFLDEQQLQTLLNYCFDNPLLTPICLCILLGLRRGESLGLKWSDFDFNNKTVHIQRTASPAKGGYHFSPCKTEKSNRFLSLPDIAVSVLENWKMYQSKFYLTIDNFNPDDYVFYNYTCKILSCSVIRRYYKKALQDCNLPDIRIHDLRHSYATLLLKKNIAPKVASNMLGHSDTRTTLDIYTHVLTNMQEPVTNAINDTFKDITVTKQ